MKLDTYAIWATVLIGIIIGMGFSAFLSNVVTPQTKCVNGLVYVQKDGYWVRHERESGCITSLPGEK